MLCLSSVPLLFLFPLRWISAGLDRDSPNEYFSPILGMLRLTMTVLFKGCGTPTKRPAYSGFATRPAADDICKDVTQPPAQFRETPLKRIATREKSSFIFQACRNPQRCVLDISLTFIAPTVLDTFYLPLGEAPPQGTKNPDVHSKKRRQLQERRRTLQTISELPVTDGHSHDFGSLMKTGQIGRGFHTSGPSAEGKTPNLSKRRSLPQYRSDTACPSTQSAATGQMIHKSVSRQSLPPQAIHTRDRSQQQEGWNARREKARIQREQAVVRAKAQHQAPGHIPVVGSQNSPSNKSLSHSNEPSRDYPKSYTSHQQLLRNSRSLRGLPQTLEWRPSVGSSIGTSSHHEHDTESSERASTDSSSYHSSHDSAVRRSRSGSSNRSFTLHAVPPLPNTFNPSTKHLYSNSAGFSNSLAPGQSPILKTTRPTSTTRSSSLPSTRVEDVCALQQKKRRSKTRSPQALTQKEQLVNIHTARLAALAALTASHHNAAQELRVSHASAMNLQHHHHSTHTNQPRRQSSGQSRTRSNYNLRVPPPAYAAKPNSMNQLNWNQNLDKYNLLPERMSVEKRAVPKRESLTQWKAEREEAKASFDGKRKVDMKERVKRANELEEEREKELLLMGKGTSSETKKERGCWSGLFAVFGFIKK
ncbi:hypothetical protein BKA66DRAFT_578798 [Pyrenochaeta sp. MPI-SDFR-AT-0127]|nr:hypothetical protein BKA66DRAFT_578798 [Pyrenochaeta sp. MPI-SDFR-AT-0127]